ncbi:glycosyltransferase family 4 protein [Acaryochloris marina]|uniref:glycosyltransferase family 4 protein n=1 Tax=Acaryochloris marina TaxID=155978 RepID=UPI001BAFC5FA|nr:glycosyltransferase family 4 protein [Acaryochloris marina]QUY42151.1 glycosyltransferase family 4 protein [Acaryochloris marina S15]
MPEFAYFCFDVVPAPKGAAIHIAAFTQALAQWHGPVQFVSVSPTPEIAPTIERWPGVIHTAFPAHGKTLIDRVITFRQQLEQWLVGQRFDVIHVRSMYEGFPIAQQKSKYCQTLILEVNGLPSIELKYRYPRVADDRELMHKLMAQEEICLEQADRVITVSTVNRDYLIQRGVSPDKIQVIANGVNLELFSYQAPQMDPESLRLLYFGTLSAWQGVDLAIEALGLYCRNFPATLTIVGPAKPKQVKSLTKLATKLGVDKRLHILKPLSQRDLCQQMHEADVILAPLKPNDRNCVQGCCPLKVLEGMASGTPVITSDLPVVQALGISDTHFLAVRPGSAKAIKDGLLRLRANPELGLRLSQAARLHIENHYTWQHSTQKLIDCYQRLDGACP